MAAMAAFACTVNAARQRNLGVGIGLIQASQCNHVYSHTTPEFALAGRFVRSTKFLNFCVQKKYPCKPGCCLKMMVSLGMNDINAARKKRYRISIVVKRCIGIKLEGGKRKNPYMYKKGKLGLEIVRKFLQIGESIYILNLERINILIGLEKFELDMQFKT